MTALEEYENVSHGVLNFNHGVLHYTRWRGWSILLLVRADAAIESLKVCGNCKHAEADSGVDGAVGCEEYWVRDNEPGLDIDSIMDPWNHCQFTPSRWEERDDRA